MLNGNAGSKSGAPSRRTTEAIIHTGLCVIRQLSVDYSGSSMLNTEIKSMWSVRPARNTPALLPSPVANPNNIKIQSANSNVIIKMLSIGQQILRLLETHSTVFLLIQLVVEAGDRGRLLLRSLPIPRVAL